MAFPSTVLYCPIVQYKLHNRGRRMDTDQAVHDQSTGDQVAHGGDGETASSELASKLWYVAQPFLASALVAGIVILVVFAIGTSTGSLPGQYLGFSAAVGGIIVLIGGILSLIRIFKAVE
jgi:hypothetical protein